MTKKFLFAIFLAITSLLLTSRTVLAADSDFITYEPVKGPGAGRHIVFLSGDEEYRSEESLPMLAKILSQRHGFKCTVLFSVDADGTINPERGESLSNPDALDSADAIVMLLRFRHWNEATMKKFQAAVNRGVPIIGLRTSTHAFNGLPKAGGFEEYNFNQNGGWGKKVLGETWVSHWGNHKVEATHGEIEAVARKNALLNGVSDVFANTDVYEAYPPADATILLRGIVLKGMKPDEAPATYSKKRSSDGQEQSVNNPAMAVAWSREVKNEAGTVNRVVCTTMGAATDLQNEGLRRLVVNGVYWGLKLHVPRKANVELVDAYEPNMYGFGGYRKGIKATDHALGLKLRESSAEADKKAAAK